MRKSLLIIIPQQFGYHIDTYYYCKYLPEAFNITLLCWDHGSPRVTLPGIEVLYIPRKGIKPIRYLRFLRAAIKQARRGYDICFLTHFLGCSAVKFGHPRGKYVFDIRTAEITGHRAKRTLLDSLLKLEARLFENITVISSSLANSLGLSGSEVHILPLGSDVISPTKKKFDTLRLLYVGTLHNRRIEDTVVGFHRFFRDFHGRIQCSYRIIGSGYANEEKYLRQLVRQLDLQSVVEVLGPIPHDELSPHFDASNVGISYIPMTKFYDVQPPTKTFEYLLSGMAVIATSTSENMRVINIKNGVLIEDNAESFSSGLKQIYERRDEFDSSSIRKKGRPYLWRTIVENNLHPYLEQL